MKQLLTGCLLLISVAVLAQTKKIAFKSHSGNTENFSFALENGLFDMDNSNFGHAPQREVVTAQLDSVIYVCDTMAILVTSKYCTPVKDQSKTRPGKSGLWRAGRETVLFHPLFSQKHSLDSIRGVLAQQYYFKNSMDSVVFIGFDNKEKKYKGFSVIPVSSKGDDNNQSPFDGQFVLILSLIAVASVLAAFISWRYKWKPAKAMAA